MITLDTTVGVDDIDIKEESLTNIDSLLATTIIKQLKEKLAFAQEEIESLKADLEEECRRSDALKTYYEDIIDEYRKYACEADKRMETALTRVKKMNEFLKKVVEIF